VYNPVELVDQPDTLTVNMEPAAMDWVPETEQLDGALEPVAGAPEPQVLV
jgi:hypothetical protein